MPGTDVAPRDASSTEVARPQAQGLIVLAADPREIRASMEQHQQLLEAILDESDWQNAGRGEKFVKKSGWRKIALAYNLTTEKVAGSVDRAPDGSPVRAEEVWRAVAPNGRAMTATGYCDVSESRFANNKGKLENDLRATAATRAVSRAISELVGMGKVSAEEIDAGASGPAEPMGEPLARDKIGEKVRLAVAYLLSTTEELEPDAPAVEAFFDDCVALVGFVPRALGPLAALLKRRIEDPAVEVYGTDLAAPGEEPEAGPEAIDAEPADPPEAPDLSNQTNPDDVPDADVVPDADAAVIADAQAGTPDIPFDDVPAPSTAYPTTTES